MIICCCVRWTQAKHQENQHMVKQIQKANETAKAQNRTMNKRMASYFFPHVVAFVWGVLFSRVFALFACVFFYFVPFVVVFFCFTFSFGCRFFVLVPFGDALFFRCFCFFICFCFAFWICVVLLSLFYLLFVLDVFAFDFCLFYFVLFAMFVSFTFFAFWICCVLCLFFLLFGFALFYFCIL